MQQPNQTESTVYKLCYIDSKYVTRRAETGKQHNNEHDAHCRIEYIHLHRIQLLAETLEYTVYRAVEVHYRYKRREQEYVSAGAAV